jgi:hypothetical protein
VRAENLDSKVYNGDIGYLKDVAPDDGELTAAFDERLVTYGFGELDTLVPLCCNHPAKLLTEGLGKAEFPE